MSAQPLESHRLTNQAAPRWLLNLILFISAAVQLSRIVQVQSTTGEVPFLSANDRSRWCTVAALALTGSYEIDDVLEIRDPKTRRRVWYTIDLVRHRGQDGQQHYYSSKPPLLPTLYTGVYLVVRAATGATLMKTPFVVVPIMLVIVNLLPLLGFWWLLARWLTRSDLDLWSAGVLTFFIAWGTYLSTFATTLNNHLPAAISVGISLWCIDRIAFQKDSRLRWFVLCGLTTSFGAANELPALSWVAAAGAVLFFISAKRTLCAYAPALLPVALAFFGTNYLAHQEFKPAYAHRNLGVKLCEAELAQPVQLTDLSAEPIVQALLSCGIECSEDSIIRPARREGVSELWDEANQQRFGLKFESGDASAKATLGIYQWGDWYDYPGSYWTEGRKQGVDRGEPDRGVYIFHSLIGHHGIFSLTPFWFVAWAGCFVLWRSRESANIFRDHRLLLAAAILATSVVAIGFYLARPLEDRNYGGVSSGFRWSFWLIPLWVWLAMHGMRAIRSGWGRRTVELLVVASVFSASFPWKNPWTSPWLMQYGEYLGWI